MPIRRPHLPILCTVLSLSAGCMTSPPSDQPTQDDLPTEKVEVTADNWRSHIDARDPAVRFRAALAISGAPGEDGARTLERLAVSDPDAFVRERALVSYCDVRGHDAIPFLREIVTAPDDGNVTLAAGAAIDRLRREAGDPTRGYLQVKVPDRFTEGEEVDVQVTLGSSEDVREARLELSLPKWLAPVAGAEPTWNGRLLAGHPERLVFRLRSTEPGDLAGLRAKLRLDYPEPFDLEVLKASYRVWTDSEGGHFGDMPSVLRRVQ